MVPESESLIEGSLEDPTNTSSNESISEKMRRKMNFTFIPEVKPETKLEKLINKIPLFASFLRSANRATGHLSDLSEVAEMQENVTEVLHAAAPGVPIADLTLLSLDFIRIPIIFGVSKLLGEEPPITLSDNARWLYAGILLGLTISAFVLPVIAPPLALTAASLTFSVSLITMGKVIYDRYKLRKEQKRLEVAIEEDTRQLKMLCKQAIALETQVASAETVEDKVKLGGQLIHLQTNFDDLLAKHKTDLQKKFECDHELEKKGTMVIIDKGVTVALASLALAGLVTTLFFPPIGLAILTGSALLGLTYLVGRVTIPLINKWVTTIFGRRKEVAAPSELSEDPGMPDSLQAKNNFDKRGPTIAVKPGEVNDLLLAKGATIAVKPSPEDSTTKTMELLNPKGVAKTILHQSAWMADIQHKLSSAVETSSLSDVTAFFTQLAWHVHITYPKITTAELSEFFNNLEDTKQGFELLKQAIAAIQAHTLDLSEHDKHVLLACPPVVALLHEEGIHLEVLSSETPSIASRMLLPEGESKDGDPSAPV